MGQPGRDVSVTKKRCDLDATTTTPVFDGPRRRYFETRGRDRSTLASTGEPLRRAEKGPFFPQPDHESARTTRPPGQRQGKWGGRTTDSRSRRWEWGNRAVALLKRSTPRERGSDRFSVHASLFCSGGCSLCRKRSRLGALFL
jgi:hypothetical protein